VPSDIVAVPAIAYAAGSAPSFGGGTPTRELTHGDVMHVAGSLDWTPDYCIELNKHGEACTAHPLKGEERCVGHKRAWEKNAPKE
jgi:hypothetical protein